MSILLNRLMRHGGYMDQAGDEGKHTGGGEPEGGKQETGNANANANAPDESGATDGNSGAKKSLTDEEARLLKENMKRKEELRRLQDEMNQMRKQFEGIDPEAARKLLEDKKNAELAQLEAKGEWERLKARMAEEHTAQSKALQAQLSELQNQLSEKNRLIDELSIGSQFSQSSFIAEELTLTPAKARVVYGAHFDLVDGKVVGFDKPRGAANRTALVDQTGEPVSFDAALKKIIDTDPEKDHLIKSKVRPGANSDSRRVDTAKQTQPKAEGSVSKIAAGLSGFNMKGGSAI